jgi:Tfp pilus assembly protein PilN
LTSLETKIKQHKPDSQLVHQLAMLKLLIANKAALHQKLIDDHESYISGFARAMTDLSKMESRDISLSQVIINQNEITFSGMARAAEAVPRWLAKFEQSKVLSNKEFSHFSLQENEQHFIDFTISTATKANQSSTPSSMNNNGRKGVSK